MARRTLDGAKDQPSLQCSALITRNNVAGSGERRPVGDQPMTAFDALLWGLLSASSLLIGAALAIWMRPSNRAIGLIMGFGSGALISAVAYELAPEAVAGNTLTAFWLALGALTFFVGDLLIDRRGGAQRKSIASDSV